MTEADLLEEAELIKAETSHELAFRPMTMVINGELREVPVRGSIGLIAEPPPLAIALRRRSFTGRLKRFPRCLLAHWRICRNVRAAWALTWRTLFP